ncbi:MAG: alpha-D-ribose 1-methylphosphonate 5-triphosphate diphosphatase [Desulfobacteraceae bacterium]|nr:alpha-D-ribose 1-methylphosphonate 5-triphosphate diphosphatase [Desulfobacteraceae bacterium]
MKSQCFHNARIYDGINFHENGFVLINNGIVEAVGKNIKLPNADIYHDMKNDLIMPGIIDLHSDAVERCLEMRPGVFFDMEFAIKNLDVRLAAIGVTGFFHAISFGEEKTDVRTKEISEALVEKISELKPCLRINHYIHFRYEVSSDSGTSSLEKFIDKKMIDLVSFMDHTPGQGQFRDLEEYKKFYCANYGISDSEALENAINKQNGRKDAFARITNVAQRLNELKIPMLSHDDDTCEKIDFLKDLGITASEFPVTEKAAKYAFEKGLDVFMGAPNLLRGKSSNGHLDASRTVESGICTGLLSDYYPESLLQAPFTAGKRSSIPYEKILSLVTSGPGRLLPEGSSKGCIAKNLSADFIVVSDNEDFIRIKKTFVKGNLIYQST